VREQQGRQANGDACHSDGHPHCGRHAHTHTHTHAHTRTHARTAHIHAHAHAQHMRTPTFTPTPTPTPAWAAPRTCTVGYASFAAEHMTDFPAHCVWMCPSSSSSHSTENAKRGVPGFRLHGMQTVRGKSVLFTQCRSKKSARVADQVADTGLGGFGMHSCRGASTQPFWWVGALCAPGPQPTWDAN